MAVEDPHNGPPDAREPSRDTDTTASESSATKGSLNDYLVDLITTHIVHNNLLTRGELPEPPATPPPMVRCWQHHDCTKRLCPVYGQDNFRCWLVSGTHCYGRQQGEFAEKYRDCYQCSYLRSILADPERALAENVYVVVYNLFVANASLNRLARKDPLTGLHNRQFLQDVMRMEMDGAERNGHVIVLLMFDLDNFKTINDRHGHPVGDQLLVLFARLLEHNVRNSDRVIRYGGDEFLVIATRSNPDAADVIVQRVRMAVAAHGRQRSGDLPRMDFSFSVGTAVWRPGQDLDDVLASADRRMYADKAAKGRR